MKKLLTCTLFAVCAISVFAQVKIRSNSTISVGEHAVDWEETAPEKRDTITTLSLYGPNGDYRAGARITFGDNANINYRNVQIGEMGNEDTDILWLHGKNGLLYTHNALAKDTVFYYNDSFGNFIQFNCDIKAPAIYFASDEAFKSNITPIASKGSLLQLSPVQYNLKSLNVDSAMPAAYSMESMTEKERADMEYYTKYYQNLANNDDIHYGFLAQDVEKVFPNLVREDADGKKYVDYIGMIPLLLSEIQALNEEIETMKSDARATRSNIRTFDGVDAIDADNSECFLSQNSPNPFSSTSVINYGLPSDCISGQICFFDLNGKMIKSVALNPTDSSITISNSEFAAGIYLYSLIVDGKEIATKRMFVNG